MERRTFLMTGAVAGIGVLGADLWRPAFAATAGPGPYGPLGPVDANGLQLPAGFTSRIIARTGSVVAATTHTWHLAPDGGACFPTPTGGWVYVSNAEVGAGGGGVSAVRFAADGSVEAAYPILNGTTKNCAGGPTPWGTWLSCEENGTAGRVWECNPQQSGQGVRRAAMGTFNHEAAAVDPATGVVYLTEDDPVGRLYRFVPAAPGDLSSGTLWAASLSGTTVTWVPTSTNTADRQSTTTPFNGGEGMWAGNGVIYFATKGDRKIWRLVPATNTLTVLHDCALEPSDLSQVDNLTVHPVSGDVVVAEDGGNMELCVLGPVGGTNQVAAFCRVVGHDSSEVTGPAFSPDGTRLYFSSQRGADGSTGVTWEVRGPFRTSVGGPVPDELTYPTIDDTYVRGGTHASTSYATASLLAACQNANDLYTRWTYLLVDIGSDTAAVIAATLRLTASLSTGVAGPTEVRGVSDVGWSGATTTWANRPTPGPVLATFTAATTAATRYDVDVTAWVAARRAEGATRVAFAVRQPASTTSMITINSRENSRGRPDLVVRSESGPPPPNVAPNAAFTAQITALQLAVDATTSSDSDGTIQQHVWDFGDGGTATGATAAHAYAAAGSYLVRLTVTDDDGATGQREQLVTATASPANTPPTAAFTSSIVGLVASFDGRSSSDPDGTVQQYTWDFGDGTSGAGATASRTYASAGTYTVALSVTDDDGATGTRTAQVSVTEPTTTVLAADGFGRTTSNGWGSATTGGAWSLSGSVANFAVTGGTGRITIPTAGVSRAATLASVAAADVDSLVHLSLDKSATGGGASISSVVRKVANSEYRLRAQVKPTSVTVVLQRVVSGTEATITSVNLPTAVTAGTGVHLRLRATGSGPTALAGKVWFGAAAEPAAWTIQATDATPALQGAGGVGVHAYVSGSSTNMPLVLSVDDLDVRTPG
ncbi:MAG: PKD domain-containing protein [Microthrixaceae bacterium]